MDVEAPAVPPHHLAQQVRPSITEARHKMAELVPGIGQSHRLGALGDAVSSQNGHTLRPRQFERIDAQVLGQFRVQPNQPRCRYRGWIEAGMKAVGQSGVTVLEGNAE